MSDILTKQDGPIPRITLNRPERGNAVSDEMVASLTRLINDVPKTADIVVLRGAGSDFCVGRAGMGERPAVEPTAMERRNFSDVVFDVMPTTEQARSFGIVSYVAAANQLYASVENLRGVKDYLRSAPDMPIQGAVEFARNLHATINSSAEIRKNRQ
jgi:hypothetical protein